MSCLSPDVWTENVAPPRLRGRRVPTLLSPSLGGGLLISLLLEAVTSDLTSSFSPAHSSFLHNVSTVNSALMEEIYFIDLGKAVNTKASTQLFYIRVDRMLSGLSMLASSTTQSVNTPHRERLVLLA